MLWNNSLKILPSEKRVSSLKKILIVSIELVLNWWCDNFFQDFLRWHTIVVCGLGNIC